MYTRIFRRLIPYCLSIALLWASTLLYTSCSSTRYVPEGKYLLIKNDLRVNTSRIDVSDLDLYLKQHPNRGTFLGMKIPLAMYNMSTPNGKFFLNKWLRDRVGEPPVLLDSILIPLSVSNLAQHLRSLGYYDFTITDSVAYNRKGKRKAEVIYKVDVTSPIRIQSLHYEVQDSSIRNLVLADSASTVLYTGRILSADALEAERDRVTTMLRNRGYYEFNKSYINFQADTTIGGSRAKLTLRLSGVQKTENKVTTAKSHRRFSIKDIYVNTDYDAVKAYKDSLYVVATDTVFSKGAYYLYNKTLKIRPSVINRVNLITIDSLYSERDVNRTYSNLSNLGLYKTVTIRFKELECEPNDSIVPLACEILLSPTLAQGYKLDLEVSSNSAGLLSIAPAVGYNHQNLFGGAELFQLNVRGAYQFYVPTNPTYSNSKEFGVSSSITLPKFLIPFNLTSLSRRNIPHTTFSVAYGYQDRPDYTRQTGGGAFGYSWKTTDHASFTFNPIEMSVVKMMNISPNFQQTLIDPYMKNLYEDHFIGGATASLEYRSSLPTEQTKRSHFIRFGADVAGNFLSLFNSALKTAADGSHVFLGSSYAQYARFDANYSLSNKLNRTTSIVYHAFLGIGKPYGNSIALPLEKMFFAGGANSLRGWQARTVGPGSAPMDTTLSMPNQVGDMLLEANVEYRFKIISYFEGALFLDAGNIWSLSKEDNRPGALFQFNQFYKDIAANTGVGFRLNLGFLVLRLDLGFKIHDPSRSDNRFISPSKWFSGNNNAWHFALNYPF